MYVHDVLLTMLLCVFDEYHKKKHIVFLVIQVAQVR